MNKYSKKYMENHCIDVFFNCGNYPIHILTAGSIIPDALNDILRNRTLQEDVENGECGSTPVHVSDNDTYIQSLVERLHKTDSVNKLNNGNTILNAPSPDQILSRFRFYANKGFYSYDCSEVKEDGTAVYKLVAYPVQPVKLSYKLPEFQPEAFKETSDKSELLEEFIL